MDKESHSDPSPKLPQTAQLSDWDNMPDHHLIEACLAGDEKAWTILIQRYSRLIYAIPLRFGFSKMIADEIFQETCLVLLEKLDTLRDRERIASWLMTVCRRACIHRLRQKTHMESVELEEADGALASLESELIYLEQQHAVQMALADLSPRCRVLLELLFFANPVPSYEAVATQLDVSVGSIGPTRLRCLKKLRQELIKKAGQT